MRSDMKRTIYRYLFAAAACAALALALAACSDIDRNGEPATDDGPAELFVAVRLSDALTETRAGDDDVDNGGEIPSYDNWSYREFSLGDRIGFFSPHGDYDVKEGKGAFINADLEYTYNEEGRFSYFHNTAIQFSTTNMDPGKCFIYLPYGGERDKPVFELRRVDKEKFDDDILRCVDYLQTLNNLVISTEGSKVTLGGTMAHSFSELIIMRGNGFDKPQQGKEQITVVLTDGYSHMQIAVPSPEELAEDKWYCTPTLIYQDGYKNVNGTEMSKEECCRWVAWRGSNFERTDLNNKGVPAWYVILPTLANRYSTVSYIELYDNEGQMQRVTAIKLQHHDENNKDKLLTVDKQLYPGWRYPIEIQMDELVPTINPYPILSWNSDNNGEDTNITNERKRGIASLHDFDLWLQYYNQYIGGADNTAMLLNYGDLTHYEKDNRDEWHFYLLSDIDLDSYTQYNDSKNGPLIPELRDILDGRSTTLNDHEFENYTLKNLKTPLVGTMTATSKLLNMDFEQPDIKIMEDENPVPAGILVNQMAGGIIENCNITDGATLYNPGGAVGIIAGQITGKSSITDCTVTGILWGTESAEEAGCIYGKKDESVDVTLERNRSTVTYTDTDPTDPTN